MHSPWALPVLIAVLVALVGGAGLRSARSAATADLQVAQQLASLQVGTTQVLQGTADFEQDGRGRLLVPLQASVRNDGDAPVTLSVLATSTEHAALDSARTLPDLAASAGGMLQWTLAVDCAAVPSAAESTAALNQALRSATTSRTQWLDLEVAIGGGQADELVRRYFTADPPGSDLAYLLPLACDPAATSGA